MDDQPPFEVLHLRGGPEEAAHSYGLAFAETYHRTNRWYMATLASVARLSQEQVILQAETWLARLPMRDAGQIAAMAGAIRTSTLEFAAYLYADIAGNSANPAAMCSPDELARGAGVDDAADSDGGPVEPIGPMCSTVVTHCPVQRRWAMPGLRGPVGAGMTVQNGLGGTGPWVARNCDWLPATLVRGTCAVFHHDPGPGRIPFVALGIMGDLDCDTGMNKSGLWLHMHTMFAGDLPRPAAEGVPSISWLFWMRHALETCETLADVERFVAGHDRDRGVILVALHGPSGAAAMFECTRRSYRRIDPTQLDDAVGGPAGTLLVTNHCRGKHPEMPEAERRRLGVSRPNSTVRRYNRLLEIMADHPPEHGPDDLMEILADDEVEMRTAESVRTIYSVVAEPGSGRLWFASGAVPAASRGTWHSLVAEFS